jgi:hypothetical protein
MRRDRYMGSTCQAANPTFESLDQTEIRFVLSLLNQTRNGTIPSLKIETDRPIPPCLPTKRYLRGLRNSSGKAVMMIESSWQVEWWLPTAEGESDPVAS